MNDVLNIKWDTGEMKINMDLFFPCTMVKLKKICELMKLDWKHSPDLMDQLVSHIQKRIADMPETLEEKVAKLGDSEAKTLKKLLKEKEKLKKNLDFLKKVGEKPCFSKDS